MVQVLVYFASAEPEAPNSSRTSAEEESHVLPETAGLVKLSSEGISVERATFLMYSILSWARVMAILSILLLLSSPMIVPVIPE